MSTALLLPAKHTEDWLDRCTWTEDGTLYGTEGEVFGEAPDTSPRPVRYNRLTLTLTEAGLRDLIGDAEFYAECMGPEDTGDVDYRPAARRVLASLKKQGVAWTHRPVRSSLVVLASNLDEAPEWTI